MDYVFGVYNALIVAVYKPMEWFICKEAIDKLPRVVLEITAKTENRLFFVDQDFEDGKPMDEAGMFYRYKSIAGLKVSQSAESDYVS